jgi:hypothetical protein
VRVLGFVAAFVLALGALAVIGFVILALPDLARYRRLRRM